MPEAFKLFRAEYGDILSFPGLFGRKDMVFSFNPADFEMLFRTEGQWPARKGIDTFDYYRKKVRPDLFAHCGGLVNEQGEPWAKLRTKANPIMMQPKIVNSYIPTVDEIAIEFVAHMKTIRDGNNEMPAHFGEELNKWALESIGYIALDQRLGVIAGNSADAKLMIKSVKDFFWLAYELDVLPSVWKIIETPKFKLLMKTFENMTG